MKQKIEAALRTEYPLGLSDKTYGRFADYILGLDIVKEDADIATAVKRDDVKLLFKSVQGEIDGIQKAKTAAENALEEYKKSHPDGGADPEPKPADPDTPPADSLAKTISDAVAAGLQPLHDRIDALERAGSAKEALSSAKDRFFAGDYAKKYGDQAEEAWDRAVELNEATGSKMTADQLFEKATGYFNKSVSKIGVDPTKPFVADPDPKEEKGTTDWSAEKARLQAAGKIPAETK